MRLCLFENFENILLLRARSPTGRGLRRVSMHRVLHVQGLVKVLKAPRCPRQVQSIAERSALYGCGLSSGKRTARYSRFSAEAVSR